MKVSKNMTNLQIADLLRAVAASYQLKGKEKNRFRIIAYQRAADAVEHLSSEAKDLWDEGKLTDISGVGQSIAEHLDEIFKTGKSKHFKKVMSGISPATFELMKISGIGPKTAHKLSKELSIKESKGAIKKLQKAVKKGKVSGISGIERSIEETLTKTKRMLLPYAMKIALDIIEWLKKDSSIKSADPLGSLRRKTSTVGDIDISAASTNPVKTLEHFTKYPKAKRTLEKGERTASIILPGEIQVDLMATTPDSYGSLLQHLTGSKHHNIALRELAIKKRLSLSEYGIKKQGSRVLNKYKDEKSFYKALGLQWIPPELREDMGEIEAAKNNNLPKLVELKDIKGDFQIHSDFDIESSHDVGQSSMEDVVKKAKELGYEYIAFTEHNPSKSGHNEKQTVDLIKKKSEVIKKIKSSVKAFNSLEIDILPDGSLPVPDEGLKLLDFAMVAIHSSFRQSKESMTNRILSGLNHPKVKILAHPTGRKLGKRESIEADWNKIFDYCAKNKKWLEINADPMRMDLPDFLAKDALEKGVKLVLGTDAHYVEGLNNMVFGVSVARRGWATKKDIVNTRSLADLQKMLNS